MAKSLSSFPTLDDLADFPNPATTPPKRPLFEAVRTLALFTGQPAIHAGYRLLKPSPAPSGPYFKFHKRRSGGRHAVILINGFMTRGDLDVVDWETAILDKFGEATWYHLDWDTTRNPKDYAGDLLSIDSLLDTSLSKEAFELLAAWHSTMQKAEKAGRLLAHAIMRTPGWRYTLAGHSLGARVIHFALKELAEHERQCIDNVYLLGGAVGGGAKDKNCWKSAVSAVKGRIFNCYSENDMVLHVLYRAANAMMSEPIGYGGIRLKHPRIVAHDATKEVDGHTAWKRRFGSILEQLAPAP